MKPARGRSRLATPAWPSAAVGAILAAVSTVAGAFGGVVSTGGYAHAVLRGPSAATAKQDDRAGSTEAIANLESQAAKLAARPGASCPQDFAALAGGRTLRISLFYGYDDHEGRVYDRVHARAMAHVLTGECRGRLAACGFALTSRSGSTVTLAKAIEGRRVEVVLFMSSLADDVEGDAGLLSAYLEQNRVSGLVKERFYRELVDSDVVFYMGHSRLGGSIGFDNQTGVTTVVNAALRFPMEPVLAALRRRPTNLDVIGMFSCNSNKYFRQAFQDANPALSVIATTGDIGYLSAEQTSLGALEAVLSKSCGHAFRESMISVTKPDPAMTYLFRGRAALADASQQQPPG